MLDIAIRRIGGIDPIIVLGLQMNLPILFIEEVGDMIVPVGLAIYLEWQVMVIFIMNGILCSIPA